MVGKLGELARSIWSYSPFGAAASSPDAGQGGDMVNDSNNEIVVVQQPRIGTVVTVQPGSKVRRRDLDASSMVHVQPDAAAEQVVRGVQMHSVQMAMSNGPVAPAGIMYPSHLGTLPMSHGMQGDGGIRTGQVEVNPWGTPLGVAGAPATLGYGVPQGLAPPSAPYNG